MAAERFCRFAGHLAIGRSDSSFGQGTRSSIEIACSSRRRSSWLNAFPSRRNGFCGVFSPVPVATESGYGAAQPRRPTGGIGSRTGWQAHSTSSKPLRFISARCGRRSSGSRQMAERRRRLWEWRQRLRFDRAWINDANVSFWGSSSPSRRCLRQRLAGRWSCT